MQYFLLLAKVDVNEGGSWNERGKRVAQRKSGAKRGLEEGRGNHVVARSIAMNRGALGTFESELIHVLRGRCYGSTKISVARVCKG